LADAAAQIGALLNQTTRCPFSEGSRAAVMPLMPPLTTKMVSLVATTAAMDLPPFARIGLGERLAGDKGERGRRSA
jgi:hypothetical protein